MNFVKFLSLSCLIFLVSCSDSNPRKELTEDNLVKAIQDHFSSADKQEIRFKNFEITVLSKEKLSDTAKPVYKASYQLTMDQNEDLYRLKHKRSCGSKYLTYKLLSPKDTKHTVNGFLVAKYMTGFWDYTFENENKIKGKKRPDSPNTFIPDSIEEIDFIKQTCKKFGKQKLEDSFAELKSKVILIDDASYDRFAQAAESIDGKKTYSSICASCHDTGESGSPRIDNKEAWHPELGTVKKALLQNIIIAEDSKHPKAGEILLSEAEILASINYMLNRLKKNWSQSH